MLFLDLERTNVICTIQDDFVKEKVHWIANLNSGLTVYQDDHRPGIQPYSAWVRLKEYLTETGDYITNMYLQFRSHIEKPLPENCDGYFFAYNDIAISISKITLSFYKIGFLKGKVIVIQRWKIPELLPAGVEFRNDDAASLACLIRRNYDLDGTSR